MSEYMRQFLVALSDYEMAYIRMEGLIASGLDTEKYRHVLNGFKQAVIAAAKQLESDE
ncbi:hypothetical protein PP427_gp276 [Salmonella phage KM16]|uniref:hypothetical protein n=1 Tax=Salmonella phage KM16 TaxID=2797303 RepID=UPI00249397ED|nr:hypothetical protein PP427_gp276 [Salmonella phage KM16]